MKPLIQVVDDTPENIDILHKALSDGYRLRVALNGRLALEQMASKEKPELVLLDIMMPEMDGFETCRRLKDNPELADIPIIFLTARSEEEDLLKAYELGAADYVSKPFRLPELKARIGVQLALRESRRIVEHRNAELREMLHILSHDLANPFGNMKMVLSIMEDNPEGLRKFLPDLRKTTEQGMDLIQLVRQLRALEEKGIRTDTVDLADAWTESSLMLEYRFRAKGIDLVAEGLDVPLPVRAEKTSLVNSVLNNLLTNAAKFTDRGGTVRASAVVEAEMTVFRLADEGIGMPAETLAVLFDPSRQTSRKGTEGETGTGFGMPLVRKFMLSYGGDITVDSAEGQGTEIRLTFENG